MTPLRRLSRWQRFLAVVGPTLVVAALGVLAYASAQRALAVAREAERRTDAVQLLEGILLRLVDAETAERGYVLTGDTGFLAPYQGVHEDVDSALLRLRPMLRDADLDAALDSLHPMIETKLGVVERNIDLRRAGRTATAVASIRSGVDKTAMDSIRSRIASIEGRHRAIVSDRNRKARQTALQLLALAIGGAGVAVSLAFLTNLLLVRHGSAHETMSEELERKNRELEAQRAEVDRSREVAERANAAKSQFLATVSHELRTPLNAIGGYVELMELGIQGPVSEAQTTSLARVRSNQRRLIILINDILNFARLEEGALGYDIREVALNGTAADVHMLVEQQVRRAELEYSFEPCAADVRTLCDPDRVQQIVLNLVTNAIKFTPIGGTVKLSCGTNGRRAWIRVSDTGRGIEAERLDSIFDPFVQVGRERTETAQQGVGLGLAISRELARAMDGDVTVQSRPGAGASFTLWLPLARRARA